MNGLLVANRTSPKSLQTHDDDDDKQQTTNNNECTDTMNMRRDKAIHEGKKRRKLVVDILETLDTRELHKHGEIQRIEIEEEPCRKCRETRIANHLGDSYELLLRKMASNSLSSVRMS